MFGNIERYKAIRSERECNIVEFWMRRLFSSIFYFHTYRILHPQNPFFTPIAIRKIETLLNIDTQIFEWGSGISTIWFAKRVKNLISVEHDKEWYRKGLSSLKKVGLTNVDLIFSPPINIDFFSLRNESELYSGLTYFPKRTQFNEYIRTIDKYPDRYFDCVSIDGRERFECLIHAIPKLSKDGFIILDDSHRSRYKEFFRILAEWELEKFDFGLLQTTIFHRK